MSTTERTDPLLNPAAQPPTIREAADDLRATADDIAADARRVASIEETKAKLEPGDPDLVALARESERITRKMAGKAAVETALAEETAEALGNGKPPAPADGNGHAGTGRQPR
jgi:hypothetical protein